MVLPKDARHGQCGASEYLARGQQMPFAAHNQLCIKKKTNPTNNASIPKIKEERSCSTHASTAAKNESSYSFKS